MWSFSGYEQSVSFIVCKMQDQVRFVKMQLISYVNMVTIETGSEGRTVKVFVDLTAV